MQHASQDETKKMTTDKVMTTILTHFGHGLLRHGLFTSHHFGTLIAFGGHGGGHGGGGDVAGLLLLGVSIVFAAAFITKAKN